MDVIELIAPVFPEAIIVAEWDQLYSREAAAMVSGQAALQFAVVGQQGLGSATTAAKGGGNTGNGTITMDGANPLQPFALAGVYRVVFTSATAYSVFDPKGDELGQGSNGVSFQDQVKFQTAAGGMAFVAGDEFDITVPAATGGYAPVNAAADDGTQNAAGVALYASDSDGYVTVLARGPVVIRRDMLVFPTGATTPQTTGWINQLTALGIISRITG